MSKNVWQMNVNETLLLSPELSQFIGANDPKLNPKTHITTTNLFESHHTNTQVHTFKTKTGNLFPSSPPVWKPTKKIYPESAKMLPIASCSRPRSPWNFPGVNVVAAETNSKLGPWNIGKRDPKGSLRKSMTGPCRNTLPKFNCLPLKSYLPNRKVVFQPSFFRSYVKLWEGSFCSKLPSIFVER